MFARERSCTICISPGLLCLNAQRARSLSESRDEYGRSIPMPGRGRTMNANGPTSIRSRVTYSYTAS